MRVPTALSIFVVILLAGFGCSGDTTPKIEQSEWEKLIAIKAEAREVQRARMMRSLQDGIDAGEWPDTVRASIPEVTGLATKENFDLLQKIEDSYPADSEDELKIRRLRHFLIDLKIDAATEDARVYITGLRLHGRLRSDGSTARSDDSDKLTTLADDRDTRERAYYAQLPLLQKESAIRDEIIRIQDSLAVEFGYGDYASLRQEAHALDYSILADQARLFITETDSLNRALLDEIAPRSIGVKSSLLRGYDDAYLRSKLTTEIPANRDFLIDRLNKSLFGMGIGLDSTNVKLVIVESQRAIRACTYPISIPDDIRVLQPSVNGKLDFATALHESGHALHYQFTTEREFEFTQLGAGSLREAYAFLIESLLDEALVNDGTGSESKSSQELRERCLMRLIMVRSYCADFLFQAETYAVLQNPREVYEQVNKLVVGYTFSDVDREMAYQHFDDFESAEYLVGWFFAAQLREKLRNDFGESWFDSPQAGTFLKDLWKWGTRKSAGGIADMIGIGEISPDALIRELTKQSQIQ